MRIFTYRRVSINGQDTNGNTPLHIAVKHNNLLAAQALLNAGPIRINTTIRNNSGETATSLTSRKDIKAAIKEKTQSSNSKVNQEDSNEEQCSICFEYKDESGKYVLTEEEKSAFLPCKQHTFHKSCLTTWLDSCLTEWPEQLPACPTCRMPAKNYTLRQE